MVIPNVGDGVTEIRTGYEHRVVAVDFHQGMIHLAELGGPTFVVSFDTYGSAYWPFGATSLTGGNIGVGILTKGTGQPLAFDQESIKEQEEAAYRKFWGIPDPAQAKPGNIAYHTHDWQEVHLFSSTVTECKHCGILKPEENKKHG